MNWERKSDRILPAALLALGVFGCFDRDAGEYVPPPEAYHSPRSLSAIFKSDRPQGFYTEAYGGFRFSSQSVLSLTRNGQQRTYQGSSAVELDDKGNFHLVRIPLSGESPVEVIQFDQKAYLKSGGSSGFRVLRPQAEFHRWVTVSLREVLSVFDRANFGRGAASSTKGGLSCWTQDDDLLCIDPGSGLPIEGAIKTAQPSGAILTVRFKFAPGKDGSIRVAPPS